jgi:hypothetical protein
MAVDKIRIEKANNRVNIEFDFVNVSKTETEKYSHNFENLDFGLTEKEFYIKSNSDVVASLSQKRLSKLKIEGKKPKTLDDVYQYLVFDKKIS